MADLLITHIISDTLSVLIGWSQQIVKGKRRHLQDGGGHWLGGGGKREGALETGGRGSDRNRTTCLFTRLDSLDQSVSRGSYSSLLVRWEMISSSVKPHVGGKGGEARAGEARAGREARAVRVQRQERPWQKERPGQWSVNPFWGYHKLLWLSSYLDGA